MHKRIVWRVVRPDRSVRGGGGGAKSDHREGTINEIEVKAGSWPHGDCWNCAFDHRWGDS